MYVYKCQEKPIFTNLKKKYPAHIASAIHAAGNLRQHEGPSTRNMCM